MAKKPTTVAAEVDTPPSENEKSMQNPAADHVPPIITGADMMASHRHLSQIFRRRRLEKLARIHPEIAALLKSKVKTPTAEAPRIES